MQSLRADREPLAAYARQLVICEGTLCKVDRRPSSRKEYVNVCIQDATICSKNSIFITHCNHIWVNYAEEWDERFDLDEYMYNNIRFRASVKPFTNRHYGMSYSLAYPQPFEVVKEGTDRTAPVSEALAKTLPDAALLLEHIINPQVPVKESLFHPPTQVMPDTGSKYTVQDLTMAKAFIDACGGHARASDILFAIPDMPVDKLLECLSFLTP